MRDGNDAPGRSSRRRMIVGATSRWPLLSIKNQGGTEITDAALCAQRSRRSSTRNTTLLSAPKSCSVLAS